MFMLVNRHWQEPNITPALSKCHQAYEAVLLSRDQNFVHFKVECIGLVHVDN